MLPHPATSTASSCHLAQGTLLRFRFARNHDPFGAWRGPDPLQASEERVHGFTELGQVNEMSDVNHYGETGIAASSLLRNVVGALGKAGAGDTTTEEFNEQGNRVSLVLAKRQQPSPLPKRSYGGCGVTRGVQCPAFGDGLVLVVGPLNLSGRYLRCREIHNERRALPGRHTRRDRVGAQHPLSSAIGYNQAATRATAGGHYRKHARFGGLLRIFT